MQRRNLLLGGLVLYFLAPGAGAENWPQFRGANRDNISTETGLLRSWPEGGPKVLWSLGMAQW